MTPGDVLLALAIVAIINAFFRPGDKENKPRYWNKEQVDQDTTSVKDVKIKHRRKRK